MTTWRKRLIEDSIPLKEISAQSAREKSIRHGHISTLHIWWARRPLVACRAAIFAALVSAPKNDAEREELHEFMKELCTWEASNDRRIIEKAQQYIRKYYPDEPPKILDMFAGGGSIPLEAQRLGCESYAIDLNPVAHLIELCTLVYPQKYGLGPDTEKKRQQGLVFGETKCQLAEDVRKWGKWVLEEAKKEIGHLYPKVNGKTAVAYIWTRTVKCPNPACGAEVPLARQTWLCKKKDRKVAYRFIPNHETKDFEIEIIDEREIDFDPTETFSDGGSIQCPFCSTGAATKYVREQGRDGKIGQMMVAVVETDGRGKEYRIPEKADTDAFEQTEILLSKLEAERTEEGLSLIPDEKLPPKGTLGFGVQNHGLTRWSLLFNPRQSTVLPTFMRLIKEAYEVTLTKNENTEYAQAIVTYLPISKSD